MEHRSHWSLNSTGAIWGKSAPPAYLVPGYSALLDEFPRPSLLLGPNEIYLAIWDSAPMLSLDINNVSQLAPAALIWIAIIFIIVFFILAIHFILLQLLVSRNRTPRRMRDIFTIWRFLWARFVAFPGQTLTLFIWLNFFGAVRILRGAYSR